jgi:hypothetical protein
MEPKNEAVCCPPFDPAKWDDKILEWNDKLFIKDKVRTMFYMPLNFGGVMKKLDKKLSANGANFAESMCLSDHTSKWNMDIYITIDKEIPNVETARLSGKFYSKVYEGPFSETGKWCADYENIIKAKGFKTKKMYMWYTTCPKCAKKYGKNYVSIISQIEE